MMARRMSGDEEKFRDGREGLLDPLDMSNPQKYGTVVDKGNGTKVVNVGGVEYRLAGYLAMSPQGQSYLAVPRAG